MNKQLNLLFESTEIIWVCIRKSSPDYKKPLRQTRWFADGDPRSDDPDEVHGNRIFIGEETHWLTLPVIMFIGLSNVYGFDKEDVKSIADIGVTPEQGEEEYQRKLRLFKEINNHCNAIAGTDMDYPGAKEWRRKMNLIINRMMLNASSDWVDTTSMYL